MAAQRNNLAKSGRLRIAAAALPLTRLGGRTGGSCTHADRFPVNHNFHPAVFRPPGVGIVIPTGTRSP
ncbi:MAG: hypothetical protein ACXWYD_07325 [Candidatus Binatia bacterium]